MKKVLLSIAIVLLSISACSNNNSNDINVDVAANANSEATQIEQKQDVIEETKLEDNIETNTADNSETNLEIESKETITRQDKRASFSFDPNKKFVYTGDEQYIKEVTEAMLSEFATQFDEEQNIEIPTPYIVSIYDEDKNDIKVYGDFYIYGYTMNGMIFDCKNGGSFPGCIHLKDDGENVSFESVEVAEDGANYDESLLRICGGDNSLKKDIDNARVDDGDNLRKEYVKMYAKDNNLKVSGIKDYGWPIILFDDISDANFVYNFYDSYFEEFRQEDSLNDFAERIENLKKKYLVNDLILKIEDATMDMGCDPIIGAQDVTENMLDSMKADDMGNGNVRVTIDIGDNRLYTVNSKLNNVNGKKKIIDMEFIYSE